MEKIFIKTKDGVNIAAEYFTAKNGRFSKTAGAAILVHMMPATKESWNNFIAELNKNGFDALTIDLRGHGESEEGPYEYLLFPPSKHQKSIFDIEAAADFIKSKGFTPKKIVFIGASIGANLSLQFIGKNSEFKKAVLLSPGLDYHGIITEPSAKKLQAGQKVLFVSAIDDNANSAQTRKLFDETSDKAAKKMEIYKTGGHGTDIFFRHPELKDLIIDFIK